jgi:hypothetical protein
MTIIEEVRREREDLARVLKKHTGIRKIVEDLYPDSAHFIYELLQNAEDKGATAVSFTLTKTGLVFEHDGRAFDRRDIEKITDIGEGARAEDEERIGRFGVGFKAVFAYCENPRIWSPTFSFMISNLVLPSGLEARPELGDKTRFEFPFDNPKKQPQDAYSEIRAGLNDLAETTLLFLPHMSSIRWRIDATDIGEVRRVRHSEHQFEVLKQIGLKMSTSHFLKFDEAVAGLETHRIAVAFELDFLPGVTSFDPEKPLSKQMRVLPAEPGQVSVFFPAEKETSGLRFHLHAPFVPELSRASVKETPANLPLFQQLASLSAASLHHIRDLGLLTVDFLSVLPTPQDQIPVRYQCIRQAITEEMNTKPLTPTYSKSHAPAKNLLQAKASLKELLSEEDIGFLVDHEADPPQWAVGVTQKNSNADRFLNGLAVSDWDAREFIDLLKSKTSEGIHYISGQFVTGPDSEFAEWLTRKPLDWHQKLYSFLYAELSPSGDCSQLHDARIVRVSNGTYDLGARCFFPGDGVEHDDVLPRVDAAAYTSGKSKAQQENSRKFLEALGVREVGEAEQVEAILKQRYTKENFKPQNQDLKRFIALVEKDSTTAARFTNYFIFEATDGKWRRPNDIFLDEPFVDTGLRAYYAVFGDHAARVPLADTYTDCGVATKRLINFAEAVGVQRQLEISETQCTANPQYAYLRGVPGERYTSPVNRDYVIAGMDRLLAKPSIEIAKLIWRTMCSLPSSECLKATYRKNWSSGTREADSQLVYHLRKASWIPQGDGLFVTPAEAVRDLLPEGFPFDAGSAWLKAIGFGRNAAAKSDEQRQKEIVAKELGFRDQASLERAKRFTALPPEEQERILAEREHFPGKELPEHEPANPERRAERVGAKAASAPDRRTEERTRSVSIGLDQVKQEAGQYLRQQYTNSDGEMICQICKTQLPFRLDDGGDYFEAVEFLPELSKRHYQNYLALCPNHAAMFQYANGSSSCIENEFINLVSNELSILLAQRDLTIYFTKTHIADLKEVIRVDRTETNTNKARSEGEPSVPSSYASN